MHYQTDIKPTETVIEKYEWQKPHLENKTGTKDSYKPNRISRKSKSFKKYEEAIKDIEALNDLEVNLYTEDWNDILK